MAEKLTKEEHLQIAEFVRDAQSKMAGVLVTQARDMGAEENTVHTEVILQDAETKEDRKWLITSTVRPLTDEVKREITKK